MKSPEVVTEARQNLDPFSRIDVRCPGSLLLHPGPPQSISITTTAQLMTRVRTEVNAGVLNIQLRPGAARRARGAPLHIEVRASEVQALHVGSAAEVSASAPLRMERYDVEASGTGRATLELQVTHARLILDGRATITVTGHTDVLEITHAGAGLVDASGLRCRKAIVRSSGPGETTLDVQEELDVRLSGSGNVRYRGSPQIRGSTQGIGWLAGL